MTAAAALAPNPGERQVVAAAGLWPAAGSIDEFYASADRAVRAVERFGKVLERLERRLAEQPGDPRLARLHWLALQRYGRAVAIAADREWRLLKLAEPAGEA